MKKIFISILTAIVMFVSTLSVSAVDAKAVNILPFTSALDYSLSQNWVYDGAYPENEVDVFLVCPTVNTQGNDNATMNDRYRKIFRYALNQQQAVYAKTGRIFAPYYRQGSVYAYNIKETAAREQVFNNAYMDVSAAFKYYIEHKNNGRPLIIAGFSQGADMCYRILEEYYGGDSDRAVSLRNNLIAVYAIGWAMTDEMLEKYPQIVPAKGETDTGVVVSFDCEDGTVTDTKIVPFGQKMISINPLNWKCDSKPASALLNKGCVTLDSKTGAVTSAEKGKYGAYIDPNRGTLIVTGIKGTDKFNTLVGVLPEGSLHLYDYTFFFVNLQENVAKRTESFLQKKALEDAA